MSLSKYKEKRSFDKTPEPLGGTPSGNKLHFVVQKHHASHLHYDFRLELRGVLKSWAVPKGLSMNPADKRLAMLVEDHPWDYHNFEGIIPSGYGAGTVLVWDEGTYETTAIKEKDKKEQEHSITSQFWNGTIEFTLHGHKLKGGFKISRAKDKGENAWYVQKIKDTFATTKDITEKDKSVLSKKTLEQIAEYPPLKWESHKPSKSNTTKERLEPETDIKPIITKGEKKEMPTSIKPMLCTLIKEPFNDENWLYEVKWDGYRIIAFIKNQKIVLKSRGDQDYTKKYSVVTDAFKDLNYEAIIDGEIVVLDENGKPDFSALQNYKTTEAIAFYAFDLLWCNGYDLMFLPLTVRKKVLKEILPLNDIIKLSESFDDGIGLFATAEKLGLEGIVAKKRDSIYTPGKKGNSWYKAKHSNRQEYVIGGWTESDNGRLFRSLIFGHYVNGKLTYVHHSGGGFTDKQMKELSSKLKKFEIDKSPFVNKIDIKAKKHWAKPELVAEFDKSVQTTKNGTIRHPAIFVGLREDKKAKDVIEEVPEKVEKAGSIEPDESKTSQKSADGEETGSWEMLKKRKITSENELVIEGHKLNLLNIERELWRGITKADLIQYYISIADYILPHIKDRPLGLNICLQSAAQGGFFLRGMEGHLPSWTTIFITDRKHKKKGKTNTIEWVVCNDMASLIYVVNLESIDIHPWTSRTGSPNNPDYIVIDLDPSDNDFKKVENHS